MPADSLAIAGNEGYRLENGSTDAGILVDATGALVVEGRQGDRHVVTGGEVTRLRPAVPA